MKVKLVLLPREAISRPIPYREIGSIIANIKDQCQNLELVDLEAEYYHSNKNEKFLAECASINVFKEENKDFVRSVVKDIGSLDYDLFHFFIDWWNQTLPLAVAVAHQIKKRNKKAKILLSGRYAERHGKELIERFHFIDYIATTEEIKPVFDGILSNSGDPSEIPNIFYFDKSKMKAVETEKIGVDVNELLYPEFDLFFEGRDTDSKILPLRLSQGCKYRCFYCTTFGKLSYYRDVDSIVSTIKNYVKKFNIKNFYFEDDALNFKNEYLESFLDKLIKENLDIKWTSYFIPQKLSVTMLKKMKKAGCVHVRWGIESVDSSIAKNIAKNVSVLEAEEILKQANAINIANQISFIVGLPYETTDAIRRIKNFIDKNKKFLNVVNVYVFKPRLGSLIGELPEKYGLRVLEDKSIFKKDCIPFDEINGKVWEHKKILQDIFFRSVEDSVQKNNLIDVDPREYFKRQVLSEYDLKEECQRMLSKVS